MSPPEHKNNGSSSTTAFQKSNSLGEKAELNISSEVGIARPILGAKKTAKCG
jgi:hypothetical protein